MSDFEDSGLMAWTHMELEIGLERRLMGTNGIQKCRRRKAIYHLRGVQMPSASGWRVEVAY